MRSILTVLIGLYLFALPWDGYFLTELLLPFSPSFIFLGAALFIYVGTLIQNKPIIRLPSFIKPLFLLLVFATVSMIWTTDPSFGIVRIITLWSYFVTALLLYNATNKFNLNVSVLVTYYVLGTLSVGLFSFWQIGLEFNRFSISGGFNPTWYAAQLMWAIIFSSILLKKKYFKYKLLIIASIIIMFFLLLMTGGRNALLALVVGGIFAYALPPLFFKLINLRKNFKVNLSFIGKTLSSALVIFTVAYGVDWLLDYYQAYDNLERIYDIQELFGGDSDRATAGRTTIWQRYLTLSTESPIIGNGINGFRLLDISLTSPHNNYILMIIDYGIIGLMLWTWFLLNLLVMSIKAVQYKKVLTWVTFATVFLAIGNDTFYYKYWWTGLFIVMILLADKGNKPHN